MVSQTRPARLRKNAVNLTVDRELLDACYGLHRYLTGTRRGHNATRLSFTLFMGTCSLVCAALALTPLHPAADGTLTIGGIAGFAGSAPMPWWARIVAGFFAIVCLGAAALGLWGVVREFFGRRSEGGGDPPA